MAASHRTIAEIAHTLHGINKDESFYQVYEEWFRPLKEKALTVMEIGVAKGGSIKLWELYFEQGNIIGVESGEQALGNEHTYGERVKIRNCDQLDPQLTDTEYDIIIDDGGHKMSEQKGSFKMLWPKLKDGGLYIIEDLHTSYWKVFTDEVPTTIDYLKSLVDSLNLEAIRNSQRSLDTSQSVEPIKPNSITFYENLCVIKK